jgi:hypothetical protein
VFTGIRVTQRRLALLGFIVMVGLAVVVAVVALRVGEEGDRRMEEVRSCDLLPRRFLDGTFGRGGVDPGVGSLEDQFCRWTSESAGRGSVLLDLDVIPRTRDIADGALSGVERNRPSCRRLAAGGGLDAGCLVNGSDGAGSYTMLWARVDGYFMRVALRYQGSRSADGEVDVATQVAHSIAHRLVDK